MPTQSKSRKKPLLISLIFFFITVVIILLIFFPSSKKIKLDDFQEIISTTINTSGGEIILEEEQSSIEGFKIKVPQDAYTEDIDFTISEANIISHNYGKDFQPITPVIKVDNGSVFSNLPLLVTIPIEIDKDEFAMGFYYDEESGELEGIPFVELNENSIVLLTKHFSNIVVSKVKVGRIVKNINTGFKVKRNNIQTRNYGTYLEYGHCSGQAIAEMSYFYNRERIGWDRPLYGLLDNNGGTKTPDLWQDDSLILRLSSVLHNKYKENWIGDNPQLISYHDDFFSENDEKTYHAIAYAMQLTKNPQFVYVSSDKSAHALTAYKITDGEIYVADPNFPKDAERKITLKREKDKSPKFLPYYSGSNAQEAESGSVAYNKFGYYGVFALIDRDFIVKQWLKLRKTKNIGEDLFPEDVTVEIAVGVDEKEQFIAGNIEDGIKPDTDGILYVRLPNPREDEEISIYHGSNLITVLDNEWKGVKLKKGDNSIGIYHTRKMWRDDYSFVNFRRYNIINTEEVVEEIVEEEETSTKTTVPVEIVGQWSGTHMLTDIHFSGDIRIDPSNYWGSDDLRPDLNIRKDLSLTISPIPDGNGFYISTGMFGEASDPYGGVVMYMDDGGKETVATEEALQEKRDILFKTILFNKEEIDINTVWTGTFSEDFKTLSGNLEIFDHSNLMITHAWEANLE